MTIEEISIFMDEIKESVMKAHQEGRTVIIESTPRFENDWGFGGRDPVKIGEYITISIDND